MFSYNLTHLPLSSTVVCLPSAAVERSWYAELRPLAAAAECTAVSGNMLTQSHKLQQHLDMASQVSRCVRLNTLAPSPGCRCPPDWV